MKAQSFFIFEGVNTMQGKQCFEPFINESSPRRYKTGSRLSCGPIPCPCPSSYCQCSPYRAIPQLHIS